MTFALIAALALQSWSFDDGPGEAVAHGRPTYLESPIGRGGRMLQLNGVDARLELRGLPAGSGLAFWTCPYELKPAALLARGWSLELLPDGALQLGGRRSAPGLLAPGQWTHLSVTRTPDGARLLVDGREALGPVPLQDSGEPSLGGPPFYSGLVDEVRALASADPVPALLREGLPWLAVDRSVPFSATFAPADHEVIAVTGGEDAFAALQSGQLAAHLLAAFPKTPLNLRNLAWEGDTVHEQWRIHNFGTWERQLARAGATAVLAWFGKSECIAGRDGVPAFKAAYGKLIDQWAARTRRVILVSPTPFEDLPAPLSADARNAVLALYTAAIRDLAAERGALFVDLSARSEAKLTRDGVHLNELGLRMASSRLAGTLAGRPVDATPRLVDLARDQNHAWMGYWRPDNWAFLNGDRVSQPSSRDHEDRRVRWFPGEVQSFLALVRARERDLRAFLEGARK